MKTYLEYRFRVENEDLSDWLIVLLGEEGFEGFAREGNETIAYVPEEQNPDVSSILNSQEVLQALTFEVHKIEPANWNERWESEFHPILINDQLGIRATFHEPLHTPIEIVITPKMSFGTGHHATTRMMLKAMMELNLKGKTVLDFGSGTGILCFAAAKLGAVEVLGIDHEQPAIENANEHISINEVSGVYFVHAADVQAVQQTFDVVLANINRWIILEFLPQWSKLLVSGGMLVLSGILIQDRDLVHEMAVAQGFQLMQFQEEDGWICLSYQKEI